MANAEALGPGPRAGSCRQHPALVRFSSRWGGDAPHQQSRDSPLRAQPSRRGAWLRRSSPPLHPRQLAACFSR